MLFGFEPSGIYDVAGIEIFANGMSVVHGSDFIAGMTVGTIAGFTVYKTNLT